MTTDAKEKKEIILKLAQIQRALKAPKGQFNAFGKYKYRSCEDILEAVKPLLGNMALTINDEMIQLGDRYYVKAIAILRDGEDTVASTAFAREANDKKGMDEAQITGAASSYARKYALNGLFCIDDTKDADSQNGNGHHEKGSDSNGNGYCIDEKQVIALNEYLVSLNIDRTKFLKFFGVENIESLPKSRFQEASLMLKAREVKK